MKIILDGFGGDNAPLAPLQGAALAVLEYGVEMIVVGNEEILRKTMKENNISDNKIKIIHTDGAPITMEDQPTDVVKEKKDSSLGVGLTLLSKEEGDAMVSAANTGAVLVGGTMIVKRLKGVRRPAIAATIPTRDGEYLLIDAGANSDTRPEMLVQFGLMGSAYMEGVNGIKNPRVGLINNGTEEEKGNDLVKNAHQLLKDAPYNFIGNVEASLLNHGVCDVAVTDGFTGNIILKLTEGLSKAMMGMIKDSLMESFLGKVGGLLIKPSFLTLKNKLDPNETGGAPLLGLQKPLIKAHGGSNAVAIKNAIYQAMVCVESDVIGKMEQGLMRIKEKKE